VLQLEERCSVCEILTSGVMMERTHAS
jgi:hypothetical protein